MIKDKNEFPIFFPPRSSVNLGIPIGVLALQNNKTKQGQTQLFDFVSEMILDEMSELKPIFHTQFLVDVVGMILDGVE